MCIRYHSSEVTVCVKDSSYTWYLNYTCSRYGRGFREKMIDFEQTFGEDVWSGHLCGPHTVVLRCHRREATKDLVVRVNVS